MFNLFQKQFIDVIEWLEPADGLLAYRYPMADQEIQNGAQLTVRESQLAMFVNEGRVADVFAPGRHTLNTNTLPVLTNLMNWDKLFQSPFKSDVVFFSTHQQLDQRWGTQSPVTVRDAMFGVVRIRANGSFSYHISDPATFYQVVSGTRDTYTALELDGQLRAAVMTGLGTLLGQSGINFVDMAANQQVFSNTLKAALAPSFAYYGLTLNSFFVQSITLPDELQTYLDKASSMKMLGDLRQYAQFQAAESLPLAAQNEGGVAGIGAGLGAGMTMGQSIGQSMGNLFAEPPDTPPVATNATPTASAKPDPVETLQKWHQLLTQGILTQEEFDTQKARLLKDL